MTSEQDAVEEAGQDEYTLSEDEIEDPITVACPECGATGKVPKWWEGLEMECKDCETRFTVNRTEGDDGE